MKFYETQLSRLTIAIVVAAFQAVTACSLHDDDAPAVGNTIDFDVSASGFADVSRSGVVTTENIPEFRIWAYYFGQYNFVTLMDGTVVTRTGLNSWTYSPKVEWPDAPVVFTAVSPAVNEVSVNPYWRESIRYYRNTGKEDLLVARLYNPIQTSGRLKIHFYHALCMVDVSLHTSLAPGSVRVKSVTVCNVTTTGDYVFPDQGTNGATPEVITSGWEIYDMSTRTPLFISDLGTLLDTNPLAADNQDNRFFIPSRLREFNFETYFNSSYLEVQYRLENPDGTVQWPDASTNSHLLSPDYPGYGVLRLPIGDMLPDNRWYSGRRYHYNVNLSAPATAPFADSASSSAQVVTVTTENMLSLE